MREANGDKSGCGFFLPCAQSRGQFHAVHALYHHVEQQNLERPARLDGVQQRPGACEAGNFRRNFLRAQNLLRHLRDLRAIQRLIGADGEAQRRALGSA